MRLIQNASLNDAIQELSRMMREGKMDSGVRKLAESIAQYEPDQTGAIFDFVQRTFPYQADPQDAELFIHPRKVVEDYYQGRKRSMDCDDMALLNAALLGSLGYPTRILLTSSHGDEVDHALAQVMLHEKWLNVDTASSLPLGWLHQYTQEIIVS